MGLWYIQQIQQYRCWAGSVVVTLFLDMCSPTSLDVANRFLSESF
jgi:hypothetical protein